MDQIFIISYAGSPHKWFTNKYEALKWAFTLGNLDATYMDDSFDYVEFELRTWNVNEEYHNAPLTLYEYRILRDNKE